MKTLKSKLLASAAMLMLSVIMVTSASFAWFTISTNPEVKGITTTVVTNETLEIALNKAEYTDAASVDTASAGNGSHTGDYYTWGNLVDLGNATDDNAGEAYAALDKTLRPMMLSGSSTKDAAFKAPNYGNDGRVQNLDKVITATAATNAAKDGFGLLIDKGTKLDDASDDVVYGYYIDYWMRSNVGGNVVLSAAADRDGSGDTVESKHETVGAGSTFTAGATAATGASKEEQDAVKAANIMMADNIRIAFQNLTADTADAQKIITQATTKTNEDATKKDGKATFEGAVVTLAPNVAEKVRVYVYLDGQAVTNTVAAIEGRPIPGALNLQFTIVETTTPSAVNGVDQSMLTPKTT